MSNDNYSNELNQNIQRCRSITGYYTVVAGGTGAIPVPGASAGIIANNALMIGHINSVMNSDIDYKDVLVSMGAATAINVFGRAAFVEMAKSLGWLTGPLAPAALVGASALGATTAALQTYVIGLITIELTKGNGSDLSSDKIDEIINNAQGSLRDFMNEHKNTKNPGSEDGEGVASC